MLIAERPKNLSCEVRSCSSAYTTKASLNRHKSNVHKSKVKYQEKWLNVNNSSACVFSKDNTDRRLYPSGDIIFVIKLIDRDNKVKTIKGTRENIRDALRGLGVTLESALYHIKDVVENANLKEKEEIKMLFDDFRNGVDKLNIGLCDVESLTKSISSVDHNQVFHPLLIKIKGEDEEKLATLLIMEL